MTLAVCAASLGRSTPLPLDEATGTIQLADPSLMVELAAAEPEVLDPVAMAFDEDGRLYVAEMRGFQLGPEGKGLPGRGTVRLLEDGDGDGRFEHATVFAEGMTHPTTVLPAYGGVLVGAAPDLLYCRDTDGDGKADIQRVLFTGFGTGNHEQLLNSLQWGLDNWIYGCSGGSGGEIRPGGQPQAKPISLRGRDFRLRLRRGATTQLSTSPADTLLPENFEFETTTGGGQYGLTADVGDRWFTCSNSRHLIQIMLPDRYLARNPFLVVPPLLVDISDHEPAARLFRVSPLEEWRVVRTRQRATSPEAARFAPTELVPGGFVTAACGLTIYTAQSLGESYHGDSFVCDASNNLVHRDKLVDDGVAFVGTRVEEGKEFLASTDNWFRPVALSVGPDGALYVVDMQREIIETPASIPADILKTINLENGKEAGRIYRVRAKTAAKTPQQPGLGGRPTADALALLGHPNRWWRMTAQRLIVERQDRSVIAALHGTVRGGNHLARLHALCALEGLGDRDEALLITALGDSFAEVRIQALRCTEPLLAAIKTGGDGRSEASAALVRAVVALADDPALRVRLQLALTLGELKTPAALEGLAAVARRDSGDRWMRTAMLSSSAGSAGELWAGLHARAEMGRLLERASEGAAAFIRDLLALIGTRRNDTGVALALEPIAAAGGPAASWWRVAAIEGLAEGLERAGASHHTSTNPSAGLQRSRALVLKLIEDQQPEVRRSARRLATRLNWTGDTVLVNRIEADLKLVADPAQPLEERVSAIELLAIGPLEKVAGSLEALLSAEQPTEIQKAAVASIIGTGRPEVIARMLSKQRWQGYTPAIQDAVVDALFSRSHHVPLLLNAIEKGDVPAWAVDPARAQQLMAHRDTRIRARAKKLLAPGADASRQKVYENYSQVLRWMGNPANGREVFKVNCAACHVLEGVGSPVGPDLGGVRDRAPSILLRDVLDPSHTIVPGYPNYVVDTKDGETLMGLISAESANTLTIRQREGIERTLLRSSIESIYASSLSMMPADFERSIGLQEMADLIAYLKAPK
ncbi:MAG: hypothetical protein AMXMBFR13_28820 [Phycisphaerae bacterium]